MQLELYFVRHGQTDWNIANRMQGHSDIPLNDIGIEQAYNTAKKLESIKGKKISIYSSDLCRAHKTAEIIKTHLSFLNIIPEMDIITDKRLREINMGKYEGSYQKDIPEEVLSRFNILHTKQDNYLELYKEIKYDVETLENIMTNIHSFLKDLINTHNNETIIVVTHSWIIKALKQIITNKELDNNITNCSISRFRMLKYQITKLIFLDTIN